MQSRVFCGSRVPCGGMSSCVNKQENYFIIVPVAYTSEFQVIVRN